MQHTPTVTKNTRPALGLTGKGRAAALLVIVQQRWDHLTPMQQADCAAILERLAAALRREPARPVAARVPLVGRVAG